MLFSALSYAFILLVKEAISLDICCAFRALHLKGLSYQDLNDGNFFINGETGRVLICDNDNVAPDGDNTTGIRGKARYMAPEVVSGKKNGGSYPFDKNVKVSSTSYYTETVRGYKIDYFPENLFEESSFLLFCSRFWL